ncbi:MAG: enoyl-CoA hydratase/isomerase family protein [Hydrogenophilaceae bacterium]|jgi:enoyl-CoA hydratase/carnithine racemase|nr:enoyl-CoA hydratase/isomerase family protein [Hydrogenophilaceae bacterium]
MTSVTASRHGRTEVLRYRNPPDGYMNSEGAKALLAAVKRAAADREVAVIVIAGEGGVFVRHYDVSELVQVGDALRAGAVTSRQFDHAPFFDLGDQIAAAPKPVIAAINGVCMGGGFELALACDLRVASADVTEIGLPETKVGIFPGGGGTQRLPRLIGEAKAMDLILFGRLMDARQAAACGLVHAVAPDAVAEALRMAEELAQKPAGALAAAKRLIRGAVETRDFAAGLIAERRAFADLLKTEDACLDRLRRFVAEGERLEAAR